MENSGLRRVIMKLVSNNGVGRAFPTITLTGETRYHYRYRDSARSNLASIAGARVKRKRECNNKQIVADKIVVRLLPLFAP